MFFKKHIDVIKNFSNFSPAIVFKSDQIKVINEATSIIAFYDWGENMEGKRFGVSNAKEFCQILSLFQDPDLQINVINAENERYELKMKGKGRTSSYLTTEPSLLIDESKSEKWKNLYYNDIKEEKLGDADVKFYMEKTLVKEIKDTSAIIQAKHITFETVEDELIIRLNDMENSSSNKYEIKVDKDKYKGTLARSLTIFAEDFVLLEGNYEVSLYVDKIVKFYENERKIKYYIIAVSEKE